MSWLGNVNDPVKRSERAREMANIRWDHYRAEKAAALAAGQPWPPPAPHEDHINVNHKFTVYSTLHTRVQAHLRVCGWCRRYASGTAEFKKHSMVTLRGRRWSKKVSDLIRPGIEDGMKVRVRKPKVADETLPKG